MLYKYKVLDSKGESKTGSIDAVSKDVAISSLQKKGFVVVSLQEEDQQESFWSKSLFGGVPMRDIVVVSRQISTLFEAQVSALKTFKMLSENSDNPVLGKKLMQVADDIQAGSAISLAMSKHPDVFSDFYVNMVKAGEESGKLNETFSYLADYLERSYELTSKTKNALIYPAFIVLTFIAVMVLMFTVVIPQLSVILEESGEDIPGYTQVVIGISDFLVNYGVFILIVLAGLGLYFWRLAASESGRKYLDSLKLSTPYFGNLYQKLYLSRIADNMDTMLSSGVSIVRAIEITASVVGNKTYEDILNKAAEDVRGGSSFSKAMGGHEEVPDIMVQMIKTGEETGSTGSILKTLAKFYRREVNNAVDTLISLIEPAMIILLGLGVGFLLTSILVPVYDIAGGI